MPGLKAFVLLSYLSLASVLVSAQSQIGDENDIQHFKVERIVLAGQADAQDAAVDFELLNKLAYRELQKAEHWVSADDLHQIADKLTLYVRARGWLFHSIYVAPQTVKDGLVRFSYKEAKLSDVHIINRSRASERRIKNSLSSLVGSSLYAPRVEARVSLLQSLAGIEIFPFYSRAGADGEIRLNLRVSDKKRHHFSLLLDDYGNKASGETRLIPSYRGEALFRSFDSLDVALLASSGASDDEAATLHGYLSYQARFGDLRNYVRLSGGDSSYELGSNFSALDMSGSSRSYSAGFGRYLAFSRAYRADLSLSYFQKQSRLDSDFDQSLANREASNYIELSLRNTWQASLAYARLSLAVANGTFSSEQLDVRYGNEQQRDLLKGSYGLQAQIQTSPARDVGLSLYAYLRGQYADVRLPGIEQISLGGIYGVRAIAAGRYSADAAQLVTLELAMPMRIDAWQLRPYLFWDAASGTVHEPGFNQQQTTISLAGSGAGLRLGWRAFSLNFAYAKSSKEQVELGDLQEVYDSESQVLFELRWN
ncbi:ShlB/FhaC/HecB family hemolysin secretion/activation protein [Agaribacterium haliotis]|uniref:ShlB/FhaC/HecB family hemolysin secretion/activation protein n=1 Tax=Agaribacterium haliotis TaxID=2013869 RepID=UPI00117817B8|nr:ShlB/FhaC/HecB family hemolysin secretion/activation protein [Agaribacterium haliotis]